MARRGFLLGRNTGKLRHCAVYDEQDRLVGGDLWLMRDCLERELEFEQVEVADRHATYAEILAQLNAVTRACLLEDTFVFYFAGHSFGRDGLQLVFANDLNDRVNWIPATQIIGFIKDCHALSKLMILDSCEAGKAAEGMLPDPGGNVRVLTATDGIYLAQEREQLKAGIFTFHLHKALTDATMRHGGTNGVLDEDGNLCLGRVYAWLKRAVPGYVKPEGPGVPEPQLYGGAAKEIFFATGLTPYRRRTFSSDDIGDLVALLRAAELSESELADAYEDVLIKSGLRGGDYLEVPPKASEAGLDAAIKFLARAGKLSGADVRVPVPLLELAARMAHTAPNGEAIRAWGDAAAERLRDKEFTQAHIDALGYTRNSPGQALGAGYLLIAFEPIDRNAKMICTAEAWLLDRQGNGAKVAKRPELPPSQFGGFVGEALGHDRVQDYLRGAHERLCIEFMLPVALLDAAHDDWTPADNEAPLSTQYPLVVRAIERDPAFSIPRYTAGWGACWHGCEPCRCAPVAAECTAWLHAPPPDGYLDLIEEHNMCLFGLCYRPREEDLREMLEDGVAMALWATRPRPKAIYEALQQLIGDLPVRALPDALRKLRNRQWRRARKTPEAERQTADIRLLWDDPQRVPKRFGKERKTGRALRARNPMTAK